MFKIFGAIHERIEVNSTIRIAYALRPDHGSDREIGWCALTSDLDANRKVTYITSPDDFKFLRQLSIEKMHCVSDVELQIDNIRILYWPFDLRPWLIPLGYLRFFIWVLSLQLYLVTRYKGMGKTVHFVTYTQLATPVLLSLPTKVFLGPVGVIPYVPHTAMVGRKLKIKSWVMWRFFMPVVRALNGKKQFSAAVVHPALEEKLHSNVDTQVISALNVDYLESQATNTRTNKNIDVIVVARDVIFKNLDVATKSLIVASENFGISSVIVNAGKQSSHRECIGKVTELGRQARTTVAELLANSRVHLTLSVELGGYINLEAATSKVPTVCVRGYGADAILSPSKEFLVNLESLSPVEVAETLNQILSNPTLLERETDLQASNAELFIRDNRRKFESWLTQTIEN